MKEPPIDFVQDVRNFHLKFGQLVSKVPRWPDDQIIDLRRKLVTEEYAEFLDGIAKRDMVETADAIADLIYVLVGTAIAFGIPLEPIWRAVQKTNMAKEGGAMRVDGKVLKPEGWMPPDVAGALLIAVLYHWNDVDPDGCVTLPDGDCVGNADCQHALRWTNPDGSRKSDQQLAMERLVHLQELGVLQKK